MAAKKTAQGEGPSKAEFVRSQPADMPAKDVVAKAKAAGVSGLTEDYVYSIRSKSRNKGNGPAKKAPVSRPPSPARTQSKAMAEDALMAGLRATVRLVVNEVLDERLGSLLKK